jgi:hypothetical protein
MPAALSPRIGTLASTALQVFTILDRAHTATICADCLSASRALEERWRLSAVREDF